MAGEIPELSAQERAGKAFPVSWDQFHRDCRALTWRLNEVGPFHAVIAITRGGLGPAASVARRRRAAGPRYASRRAFRNRVRKTDGATAGRYLYYRSVAGHVALLSVSFRPLLQ